MCSDMAFWSFRNEVCRDDWEDAGLVRVKMSWARERSGYLAYCGSEPMAVIYLFATQLVEDREESSALRRLVKAS